ncbi:hypothetical protein [uncultured Porphyromonas sp.]|uniref:hypothetical protein n=1 Tax=uncultured Porphyromonas sp. TaxID=159274 RepID=UPI002638F852|nr:hypothetical protein [uncultured Porphyromonas sp.]
MDIEQRLKEIWRADYLNALPSDIKTVIERGYVFYNNGEKKDLLITGINPSFRGEERGGQHDTTELLIDTRHDVYWSPIRKMLHNQDIDLRTQTAYLDIFYFREKEQVFLKEKLLSQPEGIRFIVDQLNLTMHTIEEAIQPKLIIVKNKESAAYFGKEAKERGWIWMGYALEHVCNTYCGELCKITGLIDSHERIAPEITQTALVGTLVLFTRHINQYTKRELRPTAEFLNRLLHIHSQGIGSYPIEGLCLNHDSDMNLCK